MTSRASQRVGAADTHHDQVSVLFGHGLENAVGWYSEFHPVVAVTAAGKLSRHQLLQALLKEFLKSCRDRRIFPNLRGNVVEINVAPNVSAREIAYDMARSESAEKSVAYKIRFGL